MAYAVMTRDPADAQTFASALAPLEVIAMPVTKTAPAADPDALPRALAAGDYDAILVASPRAAHELARAIGTLIQIRTTLPDLPDVWAVGPATKRALDIARLPAHQPADVRDGTELARKLIASRNVRGHRVLVPRAEDGRVEMLELLRAAGAQVVDVIAYRTVAAPVGDPALARGAELLGRGDAAICAVFAPSQVSALAAVLAARGHQLADIVTHFCAIGETTAAAIRAAGVGEVAVAPAPSPEGMAQAVRSVYSPR